MKLLFLCTHNACRSILAEAIMRQLAGDRIEVTSAGSAPAGAVHPLTLKYLQESGYVTEGLASKSWDAVSDFSPDIVITVCDQAAGESCPIWFGDAITAHWGLPDPTRLTDESQADALFAKLISTLEQRIRHLLGRDFERLERHQIQSLLREAEERHGNL